MKKTKLLIISSILIIAGIIAGSFLYAYFFQEEEQTDNRVFGEVDVRSDLYFMTGTTRTDGEFSNILETDQAGYPKTGVYEVVLANLQDARHLSNLRIDFKVNSSIDTYFRVKLIDSVVLVSANGDRETTLTNTGIKYRFKDYDPEIEFEDDDGDSEFWFLDKTSGWYYYKAKVNGLTGEVILPFIYDTTNYEGPTQNRKLEIYIKIEAVQAHRGPEENWGLNEQPWPEGGEW